MHFLSRLLWLWLREVLSWLIVIGGFLFLWWLWPLLYAPR